MVPEWVFLLSERLVPISGLLLCSFRIISWAPDMVADRGLNRDTDSITYFVVVGFPFFFFGSIWVRLLGCEGDEDHTSVS